MTDPQGNDGADLPPATAPENISVSLRNFDSHERAENFGHVIANCVRTISRYIDVERLDGITVAFDYDAALAELDRGFEPRHPLRRTADDMNLGIGMAPSVLRKGVVKAHLLFYAPIVLPLEDPSGESFGQALYFVAHECAHVEDLKHKDLCFPRTILQREIPDPEEAILERVAGCLWDEYAACRASAVFGESQSLLYEESFTKVLATAQERANGAILAYRSHGDVDRVVSEAGAPLCEPLKLAAYLLGHLDGRLEDLDSTPRARDAVEASPYAPFVVRLHEILRLLWSRRSSWTSPAEFDPIREIARDVLADGGLVLERRSAGTLYVHVPYRPETMPPG